MTRRDSRSRLLAWAILGLSLVLFVGAGGPSAYSRAAWRFGWDEDGNCRNTRQEVLLRDARPETAVLSPDGCHVIGGAWEDVYTGAIVHEPKLLDVDHVVPLKHAHDSGGAAWPKEKKRLYANNLNFRWHLVVTLAGVNREKGAQSPDQWTPPRREIHCEYAKAWATIKYTWQLHSTEQERSAIGEMLKRC